jgi:hypothetical protein
MVLLLHESNNEFAKFGMKNSKLIEENLKLKKDLDGIKDKHNIEYNKNLKHNDYIRNKDEANNKGYKGFEFLSLIFFICVLLFYIL